MIDEEFDLEKGIQDLGVLLTDERDSIIMRLMETDFSSKYENFRLGTAMECMADDVQRVWNIVNLHDALVTAKMGWLKVAIYHDLSELDLREEDDAFLKALRDKCNAQLLLNECRRNEDV